MDWLRSVHFWIPINIRIYEGFEMRANTKFNTTRTYRFSTSMAFELYQRSRLLGITESELVRELLKKGLQTSRF